MPNPDHLAILKEGVGVWNEWRQENPGVVPYLHKSNLSQADLLQADLSEANLSEANFSRAILHGANLSKAIFHGAILSEANLSKTNLTGTDLSEANLTRAFFWETILGNTDLSDAIGLDQCHHNGPSIIDIRTLRWSWPLPLLFLRGCGLDDAFIEYLPGLVDQAIEFYSCFLSYSSKDDDFAQRLHADLQAQGVRCWFAPEDLKIGDRTRHVIHDAIRIHDKLLIILSEHSVQSQWVEDEVERALENERRDKSTVLFPIRLDDSVMEVDDGWAVSIRNTRHIGDFRRWKDHDAYSKSFDRLLRDLRAS